MSDIRISDGSVFSSGSIAFTASKFAFDPPLNDPEIFLGSGILSHSFSQSISSRVEATEIGAPAPTTSLVGNTFTVRFGQYSSSVELPLSGTVTASNDWNELVNIPDGIVSGAIQLASAISGANSESLAGRLTEIETGDYVTGSAQIASEISGATTDLSESLAGRISTFLVATSSNTPGETIILDSVRGRVYGEPTAWSYANTIPVTIDSESIQQGGRAILRATTPNGLNFSISNGFIQQVGDLELFNSVDVNQYELVCISAGPNPTVSVRLIGAENTTGSVVSTYKAQISGAFTEISTSFSSRLGTIESEYVVNSAQIESQISGAFTDASNSIDSRITDLHQDQQSDILSLSGKVGLIEAVTQSYTILSSSLSNGTSNLPTESVSGFDTAVSAAASVYGFGTEVDTETSSTLAILSSSISSGIANIPSESISNFASAVSGVASDFGFGSAEGTPSTNWDSITNKPVGLVSGASQIESEISGAFTNESSSFSSRVSSLETDKADKTAISGAFAPLSTSISNGAANIPSESIFNFASAVSGVASDFGFGSAEGTPSTNWDSITSKPDGIVSGAFQIESEISGAFTNESTSIASRLTTNEVDIATNAINASKTEFTETLFRVVNDSDSSKKLRFDLSSIGSGITREIIMPNQDIDLGNLGSAASTASQIYFDPAETSEISSSDVQAALVEVNERLPVTASTPSIPFNNAINGFNMETLEIVEGFVSESLILSDISTALFPSPNYSGAVPNFQAGRMAVTGGYAYWGLTYDTNSNSGTVLRSPLFETFEALNLETDTIAKLNNEAYWDPNNSYNGPEITGSDLVVGEQYFDLEESNLWFECVTGSTNYWVRRGNRVPAVLSYKLSPYGSDSSASVDTPKDVDLFEKPFYVINTIAYASTGPVGSSASVDIRDDGTSIFSGSGDETLVRISDGDKSGSQAVTAHLIDSGSEVSVYLLNTGSSTSGQNYKVSLIGFWKM